MTRSGPQTSVSGAPGSGRSRQSDRSVPGSSPDPEPPPKMPSTVREVARLWWTRPDLREVVITAALLRIPELLLRHTRDARVTFFDPRRFPWTARLESDWKRIRSELDPLLARLGDIPAFQDLQESQRFLTNDSRWKTYVFYGCGHRDAHNSAECPETARLLETIPGLQTAFFSILDAGKTLPPHRGPYKGVLRYHLGLRVPAAGECGIRVGDQVRTWVEGQSLIFDDSHIHEAWNRTDEVRVVLFVDFLRPLPFPLASLNRWIVGHIGRTRYVADGMKRLAEWNERLEAERAHRG